MLSLVIQMCIFILAVVMKFWSLLESLADTKSIFFWLDAHFSYDQASNCDSFSNHSDKANMPIIEELKSIFSARPHFNDVILWMISAALLMMKIFLIEALMIVLRGT